MPRPFISVLTPAYNAARYLPDLLASVASQNYSPYEHVVIDDGSTDDTEAVLRRLSAIYPNLRWLSRPNKGQYETQNDLLREARGEIVSVICADDLYAGREVLARVAEAFAREPDLDAVFGRTPRLVSSTTPEYSFDPDLPGWMGALLVRRVLCLQHCSLFVRASLIREHGLLFDGSYKMCGDWDWIIRVFAASRRTKHIRGPFAYWRSHPAQTSQTDAERGQAEAKRVCAHYGTSHGLHLALAFLNNVQAQVWHSRTLIQRGGFKAYGRKAIGFVLRTALHRN